MYHEGNLLWWRGVQNGPDSTRKQCCYVAYLSTWHAPSVWRQCLQVSGSTVWWMPGKNIVGRQSPGCVVDGTSFGFLGSVDAVMVWGRSQVCLSDCFLYGTPYKETGQSPSVSQGEPSKLSNHGCWAVVPGVRAGDKKSSSSLHLLYGLDVTGRGRIPL